MRLLVGLDLPTDGAALVDGVEPHEFGVRERERIGYAPQGFVLYPSMTVMQNSKFVASLYGVRGWRNRKRRIREVLQFLELWDARNRRADETSGGMQKRLSLAAALFHRPKLLFVDEPTAGLDPLLRAKVWTYLQSLRDRGTTVFVTTQHIDEAAQCDRVGVMRDGQMVAMGTPDGLRRQAFGGEHIDIVAPQLTREDVAAISALPFVLRVNWNGGSNLRLVVSDMGRATADVTKAMTDRGTRPRSVLAHTPTFDEVFIELVGKQ
jgi:ABC-2 type transport system ATP-binding protein